MARIAIGCFSQEAQSFSPIPGSWMHFGPDELVRGQELVERWGGTNSELAVCWISRRSTALRSCHC